ncbi:MAG: protoheme IX farnesyltransferase [Chloroflexi bacterium]|nr:MAG: protoheme IX farnesyltransferase [Chloroflexota bacterium]
MSAQSSIVTLKSKILLYIPLIKSLQTGLLLATGIAGYLSAHTEVNIPTLIGMSLSLFLAISGSTIMNMWYDHDIDSKMKRTHKRPAASGKLSRREVFWVGMVISILGVGWAVAIAPLYGIVVFAGWFFDVVVYTLWLKRLTCWSIVWGGISGAMPILSGRVLAVNEIDLIGILLALSILFWIPTHTLTFSLKFRDDYNNAGVPTFPSTYGDGFTRAAIAISSVLAALAIGWASVLIGLSAGYLRLIVVLTAGLLLLAFATFRVQSDRVNFSLFRYASVYMLSSMIILALQAF